MTRFRLALLNPNTETRHTEEMRAVAAAALGDEAEIVAITASQGPTSIESAVDSAVAAGEVVSMLRENPACDAYLIACFGDPGLAAARELTEAPVVGIGEAAFRGAAMIARRFAVVTTLARGIPDLEAEWTVYAAHQQFSKNPWSPFDGRRSRCRVVRTLVRGETVYADGEIHVGPGFGRFLSCHDDYGLALPEPTTEGLAS